MTIDYKQFIEKSFLIKNKKGVVVPFIFNDTQNYYYNILQRDYSAFEGIRENILKYRQPGFSSFIDAIFTVDFIFGATNQGPVITGQIISHKNEETRILFKRVDLFLTSFLEKRKIDRRRLLKTDTSKYLESYSLAELYIGTAGAKTLGRGGTLQNLHWSEVAFYPQTEILNAEDLVTGAEQQVPDNIGKIFRETTGNISGDFFDTEYEQGKLKVSEFKSRFLGWWTHDAYTREAPEGWQPPKYYTKLLEEQRATLNQCYWHWRKTDKLKSKKKMREYPTDDTEAFLMSGEQYFNSSALLFCHRKTTKPMVEGLVYV